MPDDWWKIEKGKTVCTFAGKNGSDNYASVVVDAVFDSSMTIEDLETKGKEGITWSCIEASGIRYFMASNGSDVATSWLSDESTIYRMTATHESEGAEASEKLCNDLHQILCRIKPIY